MTLVINGIPAQRNRTEYQHAKALCDEFDTTIICTGDLPDTIGAVAENVHLLSDSKLSNIPFFLPLWLLFRTLRLRPTTFVVSPHALYILITCLSATVSRSNFVVDLWDDIFLPVESYKHQAGVQNLVRRQYHLVLYKSACRCVGCADLLIASIHPGLLDKYNLDSVSVLELTNGVESSLLSEASGIDATQDFRVLYIGQANGKRDIDELISCLVEISREDIRIDVVGPTDDVVEAAANSHREVALSGKVPHSEALTMVNRADVCLCPLPSKVENYQYSYPIKIFEYAAFGKAIVASGHTGIRDVLTHEEDAILVEPDCYAEIQQAVSYLARNPDVREELGNNARETAKDYLWTDITDQYVDGIRKIVRE